MSDLDDLEELIGPNEWKPRHRRRYKLGIRVPGDHPTHCKRGHELTPDNVWKQTGGGRICKKCQRLRILCREDT